MLKTKIFLALIIMPALAGVFSNSAYAAGRAALGLIGNPNLITGSSFQVAVYEDSGSETVNLVQSDLLYDPAQLEFISLDTSQSAFPGSLPSNGGGSGKVKITVYTTTPVTGNVLVAYVNFRHLSAPSSTVNIDKKNAHVLNGGGEMWDGVDNSGTYSFSAPVAAPAIPKPNTALPPPAAPVKKTASPSLNNLAEKGSTKAAVSPNFSVSSRESEPPRGSPLLNFLIASVLAAAAFVAMYFNAHEKVARHAVRISRKSAERFSRKKVAPQLEEHAHHTT